MQKMKVASAATLSTSSSLIQWLQKHSLVLRIVSVSIYYVIGITYYKMTEDWTYIDSAYFVTSSVATIGYGELHPTTDEGRLFTAFYILAGLIFVLTAVDDLARYIVLRAQNSLMERIIPGNTPMERSVKKLALSMSVLIVLACVGVAYFATNEDWTATQAFYWTVCTMTTVGYGDLRVHNSSTRLFSVFFIAICVVVYATTMYNIREYYRLSAQLAIPHDSDDHANNSSHNSINSEGDIELNPLRGGSFDSTEDNSLSSSPDKYTIRGNNGHGGYRRVGLDTVDTELDVSHRSAQQGEDSTSSAQFGANTYGVAGSAMTHSTKFPARVNVNINMKMRSLSPVHSKDIQSSDDKQVGVGLDAGNDGSGGVSVARQCEKERVDATLHLLQVLVSISGEGGALTQDLLQLRKKYDLAVPHDERVTMTRKELADLCLLHGT